jgi:cytochrome c oxidase assembly protein Cox11
MQGRVADRMRRRHERQLVVVWCIVLAILIAGLAVALVSIVSIA